MGILAYLKHKPSAVASASEAEQVNFFFSNELVAEANKNAVKGLPAVKESTGNFFSLLGETEAPAAVGKIKEAEEKENTFEKHVMITIFLEATAKAEAWSYTVTTEGVAFPAIKGVGSATASTIVPLSFFMKPKGKFKITKTGGAAATEVEYFKQVV